MFSRKLLKLKRFHTRILPSDSVGVKIYLSTVHMICTISYGPYPFGCSSFRGQNPRLLGDFVVMKMQEIGYMNDFRKNAFFIQFQAVRNSKKYAIIYYNYIFIACVKLVGRFLFSWKCNKSEDALQTIQLFFTCRWRPEFLERKRSNSFLVSKVDRSSIGDRSRLPKAESASDDADVVEFIFRDSKFFASKLTVEFLLCNFFESSSFESKLTDELNLWKFWPGELRRNELRDGIFRGWTKGFLNSFLKIQ